MLSTKIRTTIAVVTAAVSVAVVTGPIAPAAEASLNTGGYQQSSEKIHQQYCDYMYGQFANAVDKADSAYKAGNVSDMKSWLNEAQGDLDRAKASGCDWAARVAPPTFGPVARVATPAGSLAG